MIKAEKFFNKLLTKKWLKDKGFDVPRTLAVFRLQDLPLVFEHVDAIASYSKKFVVKPVCSRLSRGTLILQKSDEQEWAYRDACFTDARGLEHMLAGSVELKERGGLLMLEEYVGSQARFKWAQDQSTWGPVVLRFIVHEGKVTVVAVLCPLETTFGLAGAASRGAVAYAYLNRRGVLVSPEVVRDAQGDRLTKKDAETLANKNYSMEHLYDFVSGEAAAMIPVIEEELGNEVKPRSQSNGQLRPWSVDGVLNIWGHFIALECNHKPGHCFRVPVE